MYLNRSIYLAIEIKKTLVSIKRSNFSYEMDTGNMDTGKNQKNR